MRLLLRLIILVLIIVVLYSVKQEPKDDITYKQPSVITVEELPPIREENE
jgi:hypothetical protein